MSDGVLVATQAVAQLVISPEGAPPNLVVVSEQVAVLVAVGQQGPRGAPGSASGLSFSFPSPATSWALPHNLSRYPDVVCVDTAGTVIFGGVTYLDANNITVGFAFPTSGTAYLN